jgi:aspartokinase
MVTVSHLVEKIIEQKPFLQEALSRGIVNNAALAEELKPQIEKELKKKVKFSAVNMAIRRLSEKLKKTFIEKAKFDKTCDVTVKSDLIEITIHKIDDVQKYVKELYNIVDFRKGDFLTITQGLYEVMLITNKKHEKRILDLFPKKIIKKIIRGLSSLTISIPPEAVETIGLFYIVTRALNWENINIIDIVSTFTEMTFIVKEGDTARAFNTLKKLIEAGRQ